MSDQSCSSESNIHVVNAVHSAQTNQQTTDALLLLLILTLDWITGRRELRSFEDQSGSHAKPHHLTESARRRLISSHDPSPWVHLGHDLRTHTKWTTLIPHMINHMMKRMSDGSWVKEKKNAPCKSQSCVIWLTVDRSIKNKAHHLVKSD